MPEAIISLRLSPFSGVQ